MFKNIYNNSFLSDMKKKRNVCIKPTNLNYDSKLLILITKFLLSRIFKVIFSDKTYSNPYFATGHYFKGYAYSRKFSFGDVI